MRVSEKAAALGRGEERRLRLLAWLLGALPVGSAQHRVVRAVFARRLAEMPETVRRTRLRSGGRFDLDLSDYTQAQAFLTRRYDPALIRFVDSRLSRSGAVLVDVGAHLGFVAVAVGGSRPNARVLALEPHPDNFARLGAHLTLNRCENVAAEQLAAGAARGSALLSSEGEGTDYHRVIAAGDARGGVEVAIAPLDELAAERGIDRIDVLKLDVEGHEQAVLEGAAGLLDDGRIDVVICELNDELLAAQGSSRAAMEALLAERGFDAREIPPVGLHRLHRPSVAYENFAFIRREADTG